MPKHVAALPVAGALLGLLFAGCSFTGSPAPSPRYDSLNSLDRSFAGAFPSPPPAPPLPAGNGWLSARAASGDDLIYVASGNHIEIFPEQGIDPQPVGMISDGVTSAYGLFVDPGKNLYVCNQHTDSVVVYPPGSTSPSFTYSRRLRRPLYVIADHDRVFVGNANSGQIVEYKKNHPRPRKILKTLGREVDGLALDHDGNLFAAYRNGSPGGIEEFPKGSSTGTDLGIYVKAPQGLIIDGAGDMMVVETEGVDRVDVFPPGMTTPSKERVVRSVPTQIAFGRLEQRVYVSDLDDKVYFSSVPGLGRAAQRIDIDLSDEQGLSVSPPARRGG